MTNRCDRRVDRAGLRVRAHRVREELRRGARGGSGVRGVPPGSARGRPLGRDRRPGHPAAVGTRFDDSRLLHHEGRDGHGRPQARAGGAPRHRRARRELLARVRGRGQGEHPRPLPAVAPRGARVGRRAAHARAGARVGTDDPRARAPEAVVGAGHRTATTRSPTDTSSERSCAASPGRTIGTYFREEIAEPLGLDFWIGLPEEQESRVAMLVGSLTGGLESADLDADARVDRRAHGSRLGHGQGAQRWWRVRRRRHLEHARCTRPRCRPRGRLRRPFDRADVRGVRRRGRRHSHPHPRTGRDRVRPGDRGPERRAHEPRSPVRARVHRAVDARCSSAVRARSATSARVARSAGPTPTPSSGSAT